MRQTFQKNFFERLYIKLTHPIGPVAFMPSSKWHGQILSDDHIDTTDLDKVKNDNFPNLAHIAALSGNTNALQWVANYDPQSLNKKNFLDETIVHYALASGNPKMLNNALSLSERPDSFTMPPMKNSRCVEYRNTAIKILLQALEENFTLRELTLPDSLNLDLQDKIDPKLKVEIEQKLLRNNRLKNTTLKFSAFAQGFYQKESLVSTLPPEVLFGIFKQCIPNTVPAKHIGSAFDKITHNISPQGRLKNKKLNRCISVIEAQSKLPQNDENFFCLTVLIESNNEKRNILANLKTILNRKKYTSFDGLKNEVIHCYLDNKKVIEHRRNKIHTFFRPNHKTSTHRVFDEIFKILNISEADIKAVPSFKH